MKSKKNQVISKNNRNIKNKILLGIVLVLFLLIGVMSSLILMSQKQDNRQQASVAGGALISFKNIAPSQKNAIVSVPVYLNTQDIELNSLNLKINITGEVKNLGVKVGNKIPVKKVSEKIDSKNISLSLAESEIGKGWSTNQDVELITLTFMKSDDGEIWLSFDPKETLAKSSASDENVITTGNDVAIKIGTIAPTEVKQIQKETVITATKKSSEINNNLLVLMIVGSFFSVGIIFLFMLKNQISAGDRHLQSSV
jgi:flagellar basal body-associated protein FliL